MAVFIIIYIYIIHNLIFCDYSDGFLNSVMFDQYMTDYVGVHILLIYPCSLYYPKIIFIFNRNENQA